VGARLARDAGASFPLRPRGPHRGQALLPQKSPRHKSILARQEVLARFNNGMSAIWQRASRRFGSMAPVSDADFFQEYG
jgi:hypothetical protein